MCIVTFVSQTEADDAGSSDGSGSTQNSTQRTPIHKPFTQCKPPADWPQHPAPGSVSEEELHFVRSCLQRWRTEAENNMNGASSSSPFRQLWHFSLSVWSITWTSAFTSKQEKKSNHCSPPVLQKLFCSFQLLSIDCSWGCMLCPLPYCIRAQPYFPADILMCLSISGAWPRVHPIDCCSLLVFRAQGQHWQGQPGSGGDVLR